MKRLIRISAYAVGVLAVCAAIAAWQFRPPAPLKPAATEFVLREVTLINPGRSREAHRMLGVRGDRIAAIAEGVNAPGGDAADLAAYRGMYVLPGLIDMHTHLPPGNPLKLTSYFMLLNIAHGVTTVRDAADLDGTALAARAQAERDGYPGPRTFYCNAFVSAGPPEWANEITLRAPEDAEIAVQKLKAGGASCVKAYDGLTLPLLDTLRRAADRNGLALIGHVPDVLSYEEALLPDVQHMMGIAPRMPGGHLMLSDGWDRVDDARLRQIVGVTLQHHMANTPTLVIGQQVLLLESYERNKDAPQVALAPRMYRDAVWNPAGGLWKYRGMTSEDFARLRTAQEKKLRLARMLFEAGAQLYLGTDTQQPFVIAGQALQQEMRLFAKAGIPIEATWEIGTRQSAAALGIPQGGTIEVGAPADLLIFREDPTKSLDALDSLQAVVLQGRLYTRESLDAKVREYQAHFNGFVFDRLSTVLAKAALRKAIH